MSGAAPPDRSNRLHEIRPHIPAFPMVLREAGCPVRSSTLRSSTYRKEAAPMHPQPLPGEASRRRAEGSSRQQRKSIPKLRPTPLHGKPRPRKRRAYAHFGWPRKQPTRRLQVATPRQRRPGDLSRAGACEDLRPQPRQNSSKAQLRMAAKASSPSSISWAEARPSRAGAQPIQNQSATGKVPSRDFGSPIEGFIS